MPSTRCETLTSAWTGSTTCSPSFSSRSSSPRSRVKFRKFAAGANGTQMTPTAYDEYVNASQGKSQKGKVKGSDGKESTKNWRQPCSKHGKLDSCDLCHVCPKYHPCLVDASSVVQRSTTLPSASTPSSPSQKMSSARRMRQLKVRRARARDLNLNASLKERGTPRSITPRPAQALKWTSREISSQAKP